MREAELFDVPATWRHGVNIRGIFMFGVTVAFRLIATEIPRRVASWGRPTHWISSLPAWGLVLFGMSCLGLILAGYRPISTQGDSMDPTIAGGSLLPPGRFSRHLRQTSSRSLGMAESSLRGAAGFSVRMAENVSC